MSISWVDASRLARHTKVIAVADVVESVRLMEQDEQEFIRRWHGFVGFAKQHLPLETGRMHKSLGDGLMMEFSEPEGCIRAALAMQAWFQEGNQGLPPEQHVHLRIGAHIAEYVADEHDIYGTDVNLTARIATLAGPGEIVISAALRNRIQGPLEAQLEDLGACHLKHVKQPVHAFRIGSSGRSPTLAGSESVRWLMRPSVAVLPFAGDEPLGEAVADEAVAALTASAELQVVSRLSTAHFKQERANLEEIARHLRTHYVLRGQARQAEGRVGLYAELTDAATGHVVWAESFKGAAHELLSRDATLIRELVAGVTAGVVAREVERSQGQALPALESHTLMLAAIALLHRLTRAEIERAEEMLEQLVDRNRRHPEPHAWLAQAHLLRVLQGLSEQRQEDTHLARASCQAALRADAHSPLALCTDGHVHVQLLKDLETGASRYRQVLAARPADAWALLLHAELLALRGDGATAQAMALRALERCTLAPLRYRYEQVAALAALVAGDEQQALAHAANAVAAQPLFVPSQCMLAMAAAVRERGDLAAGAVRQLGLLVPEFTVERFLADCPAQPPVARRLAQALARAGLPAA